MPACRVCRCILDTLLLLLLLLACCCCGLK
jgi:hypothetical protein